VTSLVAAHAAGPGALALEVGSNGAGAEFSWRIVKDGSIGAWSAWSAATTIAPPALGAGTYEVFVKCRHAANAAAVLVEEREPLELGVTVDSAGKVTIRR
jgi:hypothetical protein